MRVAEEITLDYRRGMLVEGVLFPYYVAEDPEVEVDDAICKVTVTIFCDRVHVISHSGTVKTREVDVDQLAWARKMARETVAVEMAPVLRWLDGR